MKSESEGERRQRVHVYVYSNQGTKKGNNNATWRGVNGVETN